MNIERERELFEPLQNKAALSKLYFVDELNVYLTKDEYADDDMVISYCLEINHGWKMWLASINRQGYVLVPVEPNQKMIEAAIIEKQKHGRTDSDLYKAMIGAVE